MPAAGSLRDRLKRIRPVRALGNWVRIQQTLWALRATDDYHLSRHCGTYRLTFDNRLGYQPGDLSASFAFDYDRWAWVVEVAGHTVLTDGCPLWQLIMELRGYLLVYQPGPGEVVLDVGASTGFISAVFARMVGAQGCVVCVEPNPVEAEAVQATMAANGITNYILVEAALAGADGTAQMAMAGGASRLLAEADATGQLVAVPTMRLATLLGHASSVDADQVRLIKLDVEGAEVEALDDLLAFLQRHPRAVIAIAAYHPYHGGETHTWIEHRCRQYPFVMAKTIFPIHTTTVLCHVDNLHVRQRLAELPASDARHA